MNVPGLGANNSNRRRSLTAIALLVAVVGIGYGLSDQALAVVHRLVDQQAAMLGANDEFRISALLFLLLIPVTWLARPVRTAARVHSGGAH